MNDPIPHRCPALGEWVLAHVIVNKGQPLVRVTVQFWDADSTVRAWPYCPGCGCSAWFLLDQRGPVAAQPVVVAP